MDFRAGNLPAPRKSKALLVINMSEVVIYHVYNSSETPLPGSYSSQANAPVSNVLSKIARILAILGIGIILASYTPSAIYWIKSNTGSNGASFELTNEEVRLLAVTGDKAEDVYLPPFDPKLPITNHLSIPSIGVDTDIQEATFDSYEQALKKGVWRVSDFGAPGSNGSPIILAAHRFGYIAWSNLYRHKNSFYNLPKVKVGDTISIVYQQRKYTYEVYETVKSEEISDYTANLILYTCESLSGPERVFIYARLLKV